jgi:hypothetical protein
MTLTPRQIAAYLEFSDKIERSERVNAFQLATVAAQGDGKLIEKMRKAIIGPSDGGKD